jgi:hypothetical protein
MAKELRHNKSQLFKETIEYEVTVTTPAQVSKAQFHKHIANGRWSFEIELMFDVIGTVTKVESPELISERNNKRVWKCIAELDIELRPMEWLNSDHYSSSDTLGYFSANVELPEDWEIIETAFSPYGSTD